VQTWKKAPVVGAKMGDAWKAIIAEGPMPEILAARRFTWAVVNRLIKADLVTVSLSNLGRVLTANQVKLEANSEPIPGYSLASIHDEDYTRDQLITHNILTVLCPRCGSAGGRLCRSEKTQADVMLPHHERVRECIYMLTMLLSVDHRV
jgi:hypothetical protein